MPIEPDDEPWPEDPVPAGADPAALAVLADHGGSAIWGEGRPGAPLMVVLDNPGARTDSLGRGFVCGTRRTLRAALRGAGLDPGADPYITYLLKRRPRRAYDRAAARAASLPALWWQFAECRPLCLACLGDVVAETLFGAGSTARGLRGRVVRLHGLPAVVSYHPLAARRRPALYPLLVDDLRLAAALLRELRQGTGPAAPRP